MSKQAPEQTSNVVLNYHEAALLSANMVAIRALMLDNNLTFKSAMLSSNTAVTMLGKDGYQHLVNKLDAALRRWQDEETRYE